MTPRMVVRERLRTEASDVPLDDASARSFTSSIAS